MKNRKTLYYMLPLVILVWGFVLYQLFSYFFHSPNYAEQKTVKKITVNEIKKDTFSIVANYRDPFLGKKRIRRRRSQSTGQKTTISIERRSNKRVSKKTVKPWPNIVYNGMIKNNNSNKRVGIVKINQKEYLVKEGELIAEIKFIEINKELIKVVFQKEKKVITK